MRAAAPVVAGVMFASILSAAVPTAAAVDVCRQQMIPAAALPSDVSLDDCDVSGATITSDGLRVDVPPPGQGRSVVGLTADGEVSLEVSTSRAGVVSVDAQTAAQQAPPPGTYSAAQTQQYNAAADAFAGAAALAVPTSYMPTGGQSFDLAGTTLEPREPPAGCDASAVGSLWYRIQRPGTLRRIKLRADVPMAVYRGSDMASLQRVACIRANAPEQLVTLAATGAHYLQIAVTKADLAAGTFAAVVWLLNGEMRPDGTPPCDSRAHQLVPDLAPRKPLRWRFHAASTPPSVSKTQALRAVKRGLGIVTGSKNDCGLPDRVSARHAYLGTTRKDASMCVRGRADGVNSVSFGAAPPGMLGMACSAWTTPGTGRRVTFESDMRLTQSVTWTVKPDAPMCRQTGAVDLVGVVAHEAGHVFGLDHAEGVSGLNQTMSPSSGACNGAARTLGRGDVIALRKLY